MLTKLYIRNFALIEEAEIPLDAGLNILTGETGAGKSLLMGALSLILGKRVDYSMLFNPDEKCIVEAHFSQLHAGILAELEGFEEFDLEGSTLIIRREAAPSGKSRAFINDTPVSLQILKEVASLLVDLHGQHENQLLLSPSRQLFLLDQFSQSVDLAKKFGQLLDEIQSCDKEIAELMEAEKIERQQEDYFNFQLEELENAALNAEEADELEVLITRLQNAEEIKETIGMVNDGIYDGEESLYNRLSGYKKALGKISGTDPELEKQFEALEGIAVSLQDVAYELERINDQVEVSPNALQEAEGRQDTYNRLMVKYSVGSAAELIEIREDFRQKLDKIGSLENEIAALRKHRKGIEKSAIEVGLQVEEKRLKELPVLEKSVNKLLEEVGFKNAAFIAKLTRNLSPNGILDIKGEKVTPSASGFNQLEFRIRTNKGVPEGPLSQIASGGEISRVMLAIKAALAGKVALAVLIFDEIDTGISGEVARMVGRVMKKLAGNHQIIAITHLPQIASMGTQHFHIYKREESDKTVTRIKSLDKNERIEELARMISGADPTPSALENAAELLMNP